MDFPFVKLKAMELLNSVWISDKVINYMGYLKTVAKRILITLILTFDLF